MRAWRPERSKYQYPRAAPPTEADIVEPDAVPPIETAPPLRVVGEPDEPEAVQCRCGEANPHPHFDGALHDLTMMLYEEEPPTDEEIETVAREALAKPDHWDEAEDLQTFGLNAAEMRQRYLDAMLAVVEIEDTEINEIREEYEERMQEALLTKATGQRFAAAIRRLQGKR